MGDIFSPSRASPGGLLPEPCANLSCDPAHTTVPTVCHPRVTPAMREPDRWERGRPAGVSCLFHEHLGENAAGPPHVALGSTLCDLALYSVSWFTFPPITSELCAR